MQSDDHSEEERHDCEIEDDHPSQGLSKCVEHPVDVPDNAERLDQLEGEELDAKTINVRDCDLAL